MACTGTLLMFISLFVATFGSSKVEQSDDGSSGSIKFTTPDLHDDEAHSPWMPDELRCDACTAVSYQIWHKFHTYNERRKSLKYKLPESDVLDLMDSVCGNTKTWEGYGLKEMKPTKEHRLVGEGLPDHNMPGVIAGGGKWPGSYGMKEVDKVHRLSGDGLETKDVPGVTAGGGRWPGRMQDMCEQYAGQLGEMNVYKEYQRDPKDRYRFEDYLCRGRGIRGECVTSPHDLRDEL